MRIISLLILLLLNGCATSPKAVILNPSYSGTSVSQINASLHLLVEDNRTSNFTIRVVDQEPAIYLPDAALPLLIDKAFQQALLANGANISPFATNKVILHIDKFVATVSESMTKHQSHAKAQFRIEVSNGGRHFEKSYNAKSHLSGPLKHEQAKIEGQLNKLTELLITRIVSDKELIEFLQG
jgi:uncharacterized lipoprotein